MTLREIQDNVKVGDTVKLRDGRVVRVWDFLDTYMKTEDVVTGVMGGDELEEVAQIVTLA